MTTTFADIKSDIADDIDDTTSEYTSQIAKAVQGAQRYCERFKFYFNETRSQTFTTVNGQDWYGSADNSYIPDVVWITNLYSEDSNGQRILLVRERPEAIELLSDNSAATGEPYMWTYFNQKIRLYPIPGSTTFTIRMEIANYKLGALSADADTNAWLTEAYDMLKARAKYILYKNTLKDAELAAEALNDFTDQRAMLFAETSNRHATGFIEPTCF